MGSYKKISWTDADVRCPFFRSLEGSKVCCEGYAEDVDIINRFRSLAAKDKHMGRYCVGAFEKCPVYQFVSKTKYQEGRA